MTSLVSSPERLTDSKTIDLFKQIFVYHGAIPGRGADGDGDFSEADRMAIVPLVFGLMPVGAVHRRNRDVAVKPLILDHLDALGVDPQDETLVSILKEIADQLHLTSGLKPVRRKMRVSDLRMTRSRDYQRLRTVQANRCCICGVPLKDAEEHLDHKLPFRLLGDIASGLNWQLLCDDCNIGKSSWLSALQPTVAQNWLYGDLDMESTKPELLGDYRLGLTARFSVFAQRKSCGHSGCSRTAKNSQLKLRLRFSSALPVVDHFEVRCLEHLC